MKSLQFTFSGNAKMLLITFADFRRFIYRFSIHDCIVDWVRLPSHLEENRKVFTNINLLVINWQGQKRVTVKTPYLTVEEIQPREGEWLFQRHPNSKLLHRNPECLEPSLVIFLLSQTDSLLCVYVCLCVPHSVQ